MPQIQPPIYSITDMKPGDHACCIYDTDEQHRNIITPFLRKGLEQNEKVVYIADARDKKTIINYLKTDGVDVEHYQKKGQFSILSSTDIYLKGGVFDPDGMLSILSSDIQKALDEGYTALRVTAEMSWALRGFPGSERLIEYEDKSDTFITGSKFLAICQYDRRCFSRELLYDVLTVHPFAVIGTSVYNNFYYVPPKERAKENQSGKKPDSWISNIVDRKATEEALRESEERYRTLVASVAEAIILQEKTGEILTWNSAAERLFGVTAREVLGHTAISRKWKTIREDGTEFLDSEHPSMHSLATGEACTNIVMGITSAEGRFSWVNINTSPLFREGDAKPYAVVISLQDITERKRAEDALRESEERYRNVVEDQTEFICRFLPDGTHIFVNDAYCRYFDKKREEIIGHRFKPVLHPEDRENVARHIASLTPQNPVMNIDQRITMPDGSTRWQRWSDRAIFHADGSLKEYQSVGRDITDRKQDEEALHETNEYLHKLIDFANAPIIVWDPVFQITLFNQASERLTGRIEQEVIGQKIDILFPAESREASLALIKNTLEGERWESVKIPILAADGTIHTVLWNSANILNDEADLVSTIAQGIDITELDRAQEHLKESEVKFRSLVEHALEGILILDLQGKILFANNAAARTIEADDCAGLIGRNVMEFIAPESREDVARDFIQVSQGHDAYLAQYNAISVKGNTFCVESIGKVISYEGKSADLVSIRDITERKRAEETIRSALAEKEVLLHEVHHRVKNNIAEIISLIELQIISLTDPTQISLLKDLETRIRSMALVHESLYLTEDIVRINIATYTESLILFLFQVYGTGTDIRSRIEMGDVTMPPETTIPCGLVMSEIVTNSLKYAFPKTFSCTEIRGEPCTIALTLHREGSDYLLRIADNGTGMPEGIDVTNSQSLGLYLIRFIVKHQLRGSLEISTAGGTAYTIRFPDTVVKER